NLFTVENSIGFDIDIPFTRETWHGRIVACRGIGASSLSSAKIAAFEKEHKAFLNTVPETFAIPHYATILILQKNR
ncbi:MAG: class I SAM-dependent methyltransferase, partial [Candidatus Fimenecus sp.]